MFCLVLNLPALSFSGCVLFLAWCERKNNIPLSTPSTLYIILYNPKHFGHSRLHLFQSHVLYVTLPGIWSNFTDLTVKYLKYVFLVSIDVHYLSNIQSISPFFLHASPLTLQSLPKGFGREHGGISISDLSNLVSLVLWRDRIMSAIIHGLLENHVLPGQPKTWKRVQICDAREGMDRHVSVERTVLI